MKIHVSNLKKNSDEFLELQAVENTNENILILMNHGSGLSNCYKKRESYIYLLANHIHSTNSLDDRVLYSELYDLD